MPLAAGMVVKDGLDPAFSLLVTLGVMEPWVRVPAVKFWKEDIGADKILLEKADPELSFTVKLDERDSELDDPLSPVPVVSKPVALDAVLLLSSVEFSSQVTRSVAVVTVPEAGRTAVVDSPTVKPALALGVTNEDVIRTLLER